MHQVSDPDHLRALMGVGLYLAVALASIAAARARSSGRNVMGARIWLVISLVMLGMAAWRFVDGDDALRDFVGDWARRDGVYGSRRQAQGPLVLLLAIAGGLAAYFLRGSIAGLRRAAGSIDLYAAGIAMLFVAYAVIRAISFHPVDALIYSSVGPFNLNRIIDPAMACAILVLCVAAIFGLGVDGRKSSRPKRRNHR